MEIKKHKVGKNQIFVQEKIPSEITFPQPLVLVHGSFGGAFMWEMITNLLTEKGFHTFAISLRGHKPSLEVDLSKVGMSDYAQDISDVIKELNLNKPVVVGHSMSGLVVMMYAKDQPVSAVVSIDPSQSLEVQGEGDEEKVKEIPLVYDAMEAGMPMEPSEAMKAMPDISKETLMKMKDMLGSESGLARRDRKKGISVPKESVVYPLLFMGAELGDSLPFGISLESSEEMAKYYEADFVGIIGASHPGMLMGEKSGEVAETISNWLERKVK